MSTLRKEVITYFNSGNKLYASNLYEEALANFEKILLIDFTFYNAHYCIVKTLIKLKEVPKGIAHFEKYISLIPTSKLASYTIKLNKTLCEEKEFSRALSLMDLVKNTLNDEQIFDYVEILLLNNKIDEAIYTMLNVKDKTLIKSKYSTLINDSMIPNPIINEVVKKNIIPQYLQVSFSLELFKTLKVPRENFINLTNKVNIILQEIRDNINSDYSSKFDNASKEILELQKILLEETKQFIKVKKIKKAKEILFVLTETKYNSKELKPLNNVIKQLIDSRNKKNIKKGVIATCSFVFLLIFGLKAYEKSEAFNMAVRYNNYEELTKYLEKYGDDDKIHELRENKLFQMVQNNHVAKNINLLNELYPNSKKLKTIKITSNDSLIKPIVFGLQNQEQKIKPLQKNIYKVPNGFKMGYSFESPKKVPVLHYFTVASDLIIKDELKDSISLYFEDNFSNNKNKWKLFQESDSLGKDTTKTKGIKLENSSLSLYHQYLDNKFVYTVLDSLQLEEEGNFEIEITFKNNYENSRLFFLFGANEKFFNYFSIERNSYGYGYNNDQSLRQRYEGRQNNFLINNDNNILKVIKQHNSFSFYVNGTYLTKVYSRELYGNQIGFGIDNNTTIEILNLKIYTLNKIPNTTFIKDQIYYCWVNKLNIRAKPTSSSKIVTNIIQGEPVKYIGEKGTEAIRVNFNNTERYDVFYKVKLLNGKIGWVHGGGLNRPNIGDTTLDLSSFK